MNEEGIDSKTGKVVVKVDAKYFRPAEVEYVLGPLFTSFHPTYVSILGSCSVHPPRLSASLAGSARSTSPRSSRRWSRPTSRRPSRSSRTRTRTHRNEGKGKTRNAL